MKKIVIDTSVLIEYLRLRTKKCLYEKIIKDGWQPIVSFITVSELWAGKKAWKSKKEANVLEKIILDGVEIVFPQKSTLKLAGKLRAKYEISLLDTFIAACAIEEKLPLATLNIKDFEKIKDVKLFSPFFDFS